MSTPGSAVITSGSHGSSRKGNITPHCNSAPPSAYMNPMFSQFFNKLDNSASGAPMSGRVSVFSPPVNGKIGGIPGSPSPSTALNNLKLSSAPQKEIRKETFVTPTCSQESYDFNFPTESVTSSPVESWKPPRNTSKVDHHCRKDPRRVVVHPYSPDD